MRIATGVYQNRGSGGFLQFLRQEKTPFFQTEQRPDCPVCLFEREFPDWGYDYVESGGVAFVCGADKHTFAFDSGYLTRASLEFADFSFCGQGNARVLALAGIFEGRGVGLLTTHENRASIRGRHPARYPVLLEKKLGAGALFYTGLPLTALLTAEGSTLRRTSDLSDFDERIASVDKDKLEAALRWILRRCFRAAGAPYVHLWYYPDGARNVFAYRLDGDGMAEPGTQNLMRAAKEARCPFTLYVSGEFCAGNREEERKIAEFGQYNEIGCHNFVHDAMDSLQENLDSLERFERWMEEIGVPFQRVFASPRGMYGVNMARALTARGYRHSSDFSLKAGGFPFYPVLDGEPFGPLQIPVDAFNVCRLWVQCGELGREKAGAEEILSRYQALADQKLSQGTPLLFFCHPQYFGAVAPQVYPRLVEYVRARGARTTTLTRYGDFWAERDGVRFEAALEKGCLRVTGNFPESVRLRVEGCTGPVLINGTADAARLYAETP